ncbi:MAG: hypothetical protein PHI83_01290 [Sphaerochaetaceae bacterium]|jgi:large subunit ribosomal protein L25|nr:hypothetical protein [Sphaerochaetaceae bacterium]
MEIKATVRTEDFGTAGSRRLIKKGFFPGVVYGKDMKNIYIVLNQKDFSITMRDLLLKDEVTLVIDGKPMQVIFQAYQENLFKGIFNSADFKEI